MIRYIVDTHALIWFLTGDARLGKTAKAVFDEPNSVLIVPLIALAEAAFIVEKNKCKIPDVATLLSRVSGDLRFQVMPFDFNIFQTSLTLTAIPEMHDRYIVATGLYLQSLGETVEILTKDNEIIVSKLIRVVWN